MRPWSWSRSGSFRPGTHEICPPRSIGTFASEGADVPILPHFVKTVLTPVPALSRHSGRGQRDDVKGDGQATVIGRAGERYRAVPHVRREQDEQPRNGPHEIFRFEEGIRRKGRFAELQPALPARLLDGARQMQVAGGRDPALRVIVVDVKSMGT